MSKRGKKYQEPAAKIDRDQRYAVEEAMGLVKETSTASFDATVDMAIRLGVNPRHADQMVRGAALLPHGTGKSVVAAPFATSEKATGAGGAAEGGADREEHQLPVRLCRRVADLGLRLRRQRPPHGPHRRARSVRLLRPGPDLRRQPEPDLRGRQRHLGRDQHGDLVPGDRRAARVIE